jgi:DNA-binding Xre family transcriptional regulator
MPFDPNKLKTLREQRKLPITHLAQSTGIHRVDLHRLERGAVKSPTIDTLERLARALGVGVQDLLG